MRTTPLTPAQLKKLQSLNKSVTSGRWKLDDLEIAVYQDDIVGDYIGRVSPGYEPVGRLIVAVMNSLPALLTFAKASLHPKSTKQPSRSKLQRRVLIKQHLPYYLNQGGQFPWLVSCSCQRWSSGYYPTKKDATLQHVHHVLFVRQTAIPDKQAKQG